MSELRISVPSCRLVVPLVPEHEVHGVAGQHHEGQVDVAAHLQHVDVVVQGVAVSLQDPRLEAQVGQVVYRLNTHGHTFKRISARRFVIAEKAPTKAFSYSWRR